MGRLPPDVKVRIGQAINKLSQDPRPISCKKLVGFSAAFRLKVGKYRVIYEVNDNKVTIFIIKIGHRKEVYRRK